MSELRIVRPQSEAQKQTKTTTDTWAFSLEQAKEWRLPPFQRPLRVNDKVLSCANEIKMNGGVIPGIFTIGRYNKETWLVDGQHRREAFYQSGCTEGYVDVRILHFGDMAEMAEEYVRLNSQIAKMKPDDVIRGLEASYEPIYKLRKRCPFLGYDNIRRSEKAPVLSMAQGIRNWTGSVSDPPRSCNIAAAQLAQQFSMDDCEQMSQFMLCAFGAWGKDAANNKLWGGLNLTLCMWLWRRLVLNPAPGGRVLKVSPEDFGKCLMTMAANTIYPEWLVGRMITDNKSLSPCYSRIKGIFAARLEQITGAKRVSLPAPPWANAQTDVRQAFRTRING